MRKEFVMSLLFDDGRTPQKKENSDVLHRTTFPKLAGLDALQDRLQRLLSKLLLPEPSIRVSKK